MRSFAMRLHQLERICSDTAKIRSSVRVKGVGDVKEAAPEDLGPFIISTCNNATNPSTAFTPVEASPTEAKWLIPWLVLDNRPVRYTAVVRYVKLPETLCPTKDGRVDAMEICSEEEEMEVARVCTLSGDETVLVDGEEKVNDSESEEEEALEEELEDEELEGMRAYESVGGADF